MPNGSSTTTPLTRNDFMSQDNKTNEDLAPTVLVGTYREANAKWIAEKKLYNLPLPVGYHFEQYQKFTHIVLFAGDGEPVAYRAKMDSVRDKAWLCSNGYSVSSSPHGKEYVIFSLGRKVRYDSILSDPTADVFVCSSRFTGQIDMVYGFVPRQYRDLFDCHASPLADRAIPR